MRLVFYFQLAMLRSVLLFALAFLAACAGGSADVPSQGPAPPTSAYSVRSVRGFRVLVSPELASHPSELADGMNVLDDRLAHAESILPPERMEKLRRARIWMEWRDPPFRGCVFQVSAKWLSAQGLNPDKAGDIEIANVTDFVEWSRGDFPLLLLHELAHAFHHHVLGRTNPDVQACYSAAMRAKMYDFVPYYRGGRRRAKAADTVYEYFAESTEAFFGNNEFFPFSREGLRSFDPCAYALMVRAWTEPIADVE